MTSFKRLGAAGFRIKPWELFFLIFLIMISADLTLIPLQLDLGASENRFTVRFQ